MNADERERFIDERERFLSELLIRALERGGPAAVAGVAVAAAEGAAAGLPEGLIPEFCDALIAAVVSGAQRAGHDIHIVRRRLDEKRQGTMH